LIVIRSVEQTVRLSRTKPTVADALCAVEDLRARGLVSLEENPAQRRSKHVRATAQVREKADQGRNERDDLYPHILPPGSA
jgi:DNA-binding MarR family transcriptional regulator